MSEIGTPSRTEFQTGEGTKRVTQTATTSDEGKAEQQPGGKQSHKSEQKEETPKQPRGHDPAVNISASLANLEVGGKIIANHIDHDGDARPIITTEQGSYTLKYEAADEKNVQKLLRQYPIEIRILSIDQDIKAEIIPPAQERQKADNGLKEAVAISLTLTNLGHSPPRVTRPVSQEVLPQEKSNLQYRATDLYRAESIARESAVKIGELPLPTSSAGYILYQKKAPEQPKTPPTSPVSASVIAQEYSSPEGKQNIPPSAAQLSGNGATLQATQAENITVKPDALNGFLQKTISATVVKTFPRLNVPLPEKILKEIGLTTPLDHFTKGQKFSIRIDSLAIPTPPATNTAKADTGPQTGTEKSAPSVPSGPQGTFAGQKPAPDNPDNKNSPAHPAVSETAPNKTPLAPLNKAGVSISGIIIDPSHSLLEKNAQNSAKQAEAMPAYLKRQNLGLKAPSETAQAPKDFYLATPISVIKIKSSLNLVPGTIIGFSLSRGEGQNISAPEKQSPKAPNQTNISTQTNISSAISSALSPGKNENITEYARDGIQKTNAQSEVSSPSAPPLVETEKLPLQPLDEIYEDWQSLSLMLSSLGHAQNMAAPAAQIMKSRMPSPQNPQQMTSTMVFFMAALGSANPARTWLGPDVSQQLERMGQEKLIRGLDMDMQRIRSLSTDSPPGEWRPLLLPFQNGPEVNALPMLIRQVQEEEEQDKASEDGEENQNLTATRFIVEFDLKHMGQLLLDGLLKERQLDIIIRAEMRLPSQMKLKLAGLYSNALAKQDFTGELEFRDGITPDLSVKRTINQKIYLSAQK